MITPYNHAPTLRALLERAREYVEEDVLNYRVACRYPTLSESLRNELEIETPPSIALLVEINAALTYESEN
jgi:hypothetical protein